MGRPASGTDLRLLKAGRLLIREKGITGLSVREACRRAGANTGMFHYYFGSKDEFLKAILKEAYGEFMAGFEVVVAEGATPREKLKNALIAVGRFAREVRSALPAIFADVLLGKKEAFEFVRANFLEHVVQIAGLAAECRPRSAFRAHTVQFMIGSMIPVMVFPAILAGVAERNGLGTLGGVPVAELSEEFFSEEGIAERAEAAMRGAGL